MPHRMPLYERVMGKRFAALPAAVRSMHEVHGDAGAAGEGSVSVGGGMIGTLIRRAMHFPSAGSYQVRVSFAERDGVETWMRDFGGHRFYSRLSQVKGRLNEQFGPLRFAFDLPSDGEGLRMVLRGWSLFGVSMPRWLGLRVEAAEWEESGVFRFDVAVALPAVGPIIRYSGRLKRLDMADTKGRPGRSGPPSRKSTVTP
jgi:hypothetical protein